MFEQYRDAFSALASQAKDAPSAHLVAELFDILARTLERLDQPEHWADVDAHPPAEVAGTRFEQMGWDMLRALKPTAQDPESRSQAIRAAQTTAMLLRARFPTRT